MGSFHGDHHLLVRAYQKARYTHLYDNVWVELAGEG
jgi:hypothetical protein